MSRWPIALAVLVALACSACGLTRGQSAALHAQDFAIQDLAACACPDKVAALDRSHKALRESLETDHWYEALWRSVADALSD